MVKNYNDELAVWVKKRPEKKRRLDTAFVSFISVKADVLEAVQAGYSMMTIWEHMTSVRRIDMSYETFRRHVKRFTAKPKSHSAPAEPRNNQCDDRENTTMRGFNFNPTPRKEDLF